MDFYSKQNGSFCIRRDFEFCWVKKRFFFQKNVSVGIRIAFYSKQNGSVRIRNDLFSKLINGFDELRKNFMFNKTVLMD